MVLWLCHLGRRPARFPLLSVGFLLPVCSLGFLGGAVGGVAALRVSEQSFRGVGSNSGAGLQLRLRPWSRRPCSLLRFLGGPGWWRMNTAGVWGQDGAAFFSV